MIRIFLMSVRLGMCYASATVRKPRSSVPSLHQVKKLLEQIIRIVRTGRSFGMILNAECRQGAVFETFDRVVVQIDVRDVDVVQVQAFRIDGETVILSRDLHLLPLQIKDGMVSAMMA